MKPDMIGAGLRMAIVSASRLTDYRALTFRFSPGFSLSTPEQAVEYVKERGFIFFWPVKGFTFPNLWGAVAGDRPVTDGHDDPGISPGTGRTLFSTRESGIMPGCSGARTRLSHWTL